MDYIISNLGDIPDITKLIEELREQINQKQDKLVSGENIKTLNNQPVLGAGNLPVDTLSSDLVVANSIGGIPGGRVYAAGTSLETILRDLLTQPTQIYAFQLDDILCIVPRTPTTWNTWVDSMYNTHGLVVAFNNIYTADHRRVEHNGTPVLDTDLIIPNAIYVSNVVE